MNHNFLKYHLERKLQKLCEEDFYDGVKHFSFHLDHPSLSVLIDVCIVLTFSIAECVF